ncbi:glutathione transferase GstA [Erwinia aphidicola]|jgi:glutathione S-transferase|uniref:Glutathione transferase GstA n=1 Tax=Erwinia aphidicola TaxID=68334 RepID=A0ABU8DJA7_ERWAP|nr:glutathione transferase GstA [Erwinia aphidicola]KMV70493.1 glutathione S-transferase [bacteria symbiont BFo1 of Frankliniella occidentalis]PIJ58092.1 glutathione S-transferase [Erwinia sp. OLMDLW33]KYP84641.1 glutathione S-transferase [bacteria symbiont BFo1 of Frankliniella occidentalis]KYP89976.1 glutathione S-transferase [bacteria symbiont BFo1 of Frankliniella occidentalis]MBD1376924.1 glutathione transferase GstA [Erwinia aphidicola]
MKLYCKSGACSLSPHIVLRETGLDFTLVNVDLKAKTTEQGEDYLLINPKGQVPALELNDGSVLTEGVAIVQYLADLKSDRQLLAPAGSLTRYHTLEWLNFIATELHKGFSPLFRPTTPEEVKTLAREQLLQKFQYVNNELKEKQWLLGLRFTVADAYLFTVTRWAHAIKLDLSGLSALNEWFERVAARPAVAAALKAEGLN